MAEDSITKAILVDTYNVYKDRLEEFELCDTRTLAHQMRVMITHNKINPKVYEVSKVDDTIPAGLVNVTLKQVPYNPKTDNPDLMVCDYYDATGDTIIGDQADVEDAYTAGEIQYMAVNTDGELEPTLEPDGLNIGETYYLNVDTDDPEGLNFRWKITLVDDNDEYTETERVQLEKLMVIRKVDNTTISLKPGKSNRLKGLKFNLNACDITEEIESSILLEVNI